MISTLLDGRGNRTTVSGDKEIKQDEYNHDLEKACVALLNAIERKSIPDLIQASKDVHIELHKEPPFDNVPEESEES